NCARSSLVDSDTGTNPSTDVIGACDINGSRKDPERESAFDPGPRTAGPQCRPIYLRASVMRRPLLLRTHFLNRRRHAANACWPRFGVRSGMIGRGYRGVDHWIQSPVTM